MDVKVFQLFRFEVTRILRTNNYFGTNIIFKILDQPVLKIITIFIEILKFIVNLDEGLIGFINYFIFSQKKFLEFLNPLKF